MLDKLAAWSEQPTTSTLDVPNGNTPWAQRYAADLRDVIIRYASRLPRNVQRHLGPSELGHDCDRQLVGKMAGVSFGSGGNQLHDPWASIVGTALHDFMDKAFTWESEHGLNPGRWFSEKRVTPDPGAEQPHPGTADLYDAMHASVDDWKMQSEAIRARLRRHGPPKHYYLQLLLYATGYMHLGFPVSRVVLISMPRTKSTMSDMYVWEHPFGAAEIREVIELLDRTVTREALAKMLTAGQLSFWEVPATPSTEDCEYCPFFNAAAMEEGTRLGCPGTSMTRKRD